MRKDILDFVQDVKETFKMEAIYFPDNDVYSLRKNGRGVQNFNSGNFYQLPKSYRKAQIRGIIQKGLTHNMGEKTVRDNMFLSNRMGKSI